MLIHNFTAPFFQKDYIETSDDKDEYLENDIYYIFKVITQMDISEKGFFENSIKGLSVIIEAHYFKTENKIFEEYHLIQENIYIWSEYSKKIYASTNGLQNYIKKFKNYLPTEQYEYMINFTEFILLEIKRTKGISIFQNKYIKELDEIRQKSENDKKDIISIVSILLAIIPFLMLNISNISQSTDIYNLILINCILLCVIGVIFLLLSIYLITFRQVLVAFLLILAGIYGIQFVFNDENYQRQQYIQNYYQ